jgi:CYTH domain-containing protein
MTKEKVIKVQSALLGAQLALEKTFMDIAASEEGPALVVCDRGAMDGKAYCSDETWEAILTQMGVDVVQLRDRQYDAVYHLVTAAVGAEEFYGSDTNAARRETVEEARALDSKTLNTYLGHPHLRIIDNSCDFATKVERVINSISEGMGVAIPTQGSYRRYLVKPPVPKTLPVHTEVVDIEIAILRNSKPDRELRIIRRGQKNRYTYFYQQLRFVSERPVLTEKRLTQEEYQDMKEQVDPDFELISKHSMSFTYQNQYFELGTFITPVEYRGKALLYIETGDHCHDPQLPPFIPLDREVTDDPDYNNMAIAQNDYSALDGGRTQTRLSITVSDLGMSMRSMGNISSMLHGLSSPKHRDKEMRKPFPEMIPGIPALNPN